MKKIGLFSAFMLLAVGMLPACNSVDGDGKEGMTEEEMLNQTIALYTFSLPESLEKKDETVGDWHLKRLNDGTVVEATFSNSQNPPVSAEEFFSEYLPLTDDNKLVFSESNTYGEEVKVYTQQYKGKDVDISYRCYYTVDGKALQRLVGYFMPIDHLDVNPKISKVLAARIGEAFLKKKCSQGSEGSEQLTDPQIKVYIKDGRRFAHLVYTLYSQTRGEVSWYSCDIDAHTGRILSYDSVIVG